MNKTKYSFEQFYIAKHLLRWSLLIFPVSVVIGLLVAFFLWLLDIATATRWQNMWLIFLLPLAGIIISLLYRYFGKNADAGNNLIMDEIHKPGGGVPARMTPLILFTTLLTHLLAVRQAGKVQRCRWVAALLLCSPGGLSCTTNEKEFC
jgi:H+/Cl- antiporter ClcA